MANSPDEVAQAIKTRLSLWLGKWFLDSEEGRPCLQSVLDKPYLDAYGMTNKQRILDTPGVTELTDFNLIQKIQPPENSLLPLKFKRNTAKLH
ncbi:MAG: hypothetical protein ACL7BU_16430 [Candidatus Phlomobacter fragariae]